MFGIWLVLVLLLLLRPYTELKVTTQLDSMLNLHGPVDC